MAYCYECGSEVAQNDAFCPYCGISLKPFNLAEDKSDEDSGAEIDNFAPPSDSANASSQTDLPVNTSAEVGEPNETAPNIEAAETEENFKLTEETEESAAGITDNKDIKTESSQNETKNDDFSEIPTPAIIENLEAFSAVSNRRAEEIEKKPENSESAELEDFGLVENSPEENNREFLPENQSNYPSATEEIEESAPIFEESVVEKNENNIPQIEAEPVKENNLSDSQTVQSDYSVNSEILGEKNLQENAPSENSGSERTQNDDFSATIPDIPPAENASKQFESEESNLSASIAEASQNDSQKDEKIESIAKPADELENSEPPPSIFDSVRIMEGKDSFGKNSNFEPENLTPIEDSAEQTGDKNEIPQNSQPENNFSNTTPNIGGSDTDGKKAAKLKPLDEGTVLNNRYEIIRKIGGGGMGAVYLASDNNLGGVLRAVKEMVQSYIEEEQQEKSINDFKRESMILSTLDHTGIPTIYDYFFDEKESRFYLVMKYINGGDLSGRLRAAPEGKIDEKTVTEWAIQIADVLDYLHNRPSTIVYRDLKPANVMIDGNSGRIMLIDFGIARSINKEEKGVTAVGTMGYAPPELFSGNVEPRSDIYSLGSTMFHLLTGADPQSNPLLIFDFQKNPRPRQINSQLSDQIERILMRAVEYNSTARFGSAVELKRVLEDHLENLKAGKVTYGIKEAPQSVSLANQIVFCGFCGQKIVASDMFCAFCGSKQPLSQQGVHAEIYSSVPQTAKLMILGTNELESPVFNLEKDESFVGRRDPQSGIFPEVDLSKFDPQTKISRRHARIWRDGGNFLVEDLGSSNGTVVMPSVSDVVRLLPHQPHILASGDKIRVGDTTLHFVKG